MPPTTYLVLLWRISIHILYPFIYMNSSLQDALGADYKEMWSKPHRYHDEDLERSLKSCLLLAMVLEIIHSIRLV
ncbi:uncharacterized protein Dwil_GK27849 [Drosophila willistoni]|uniref:Uncharacterized protein n=1 Tax=Drosophila willistoni TaxID=7260 RepID=A0A0Q9WVE8_DROWI|nr:uncharacterized protein LOC26529851 [Drosophila willistoni]KRG00091.1 uncharacterized protein Dwil_GK27849 [Drosophila willistoni]